MSFRNTRIIKSMILNALFFGCGNLYAGHAAVFILPMMTLIVAYYAIGYAGLLSVVFVNLFFWVAIAGYIIFSVIYVAYLTKNKYRKMWYGKWYVQILWVVALSLFGAYRPSNEELGYSIYKIQSKELFPLIREGEYIIADTYAYKNNRYPEVGEFVMVNSSNPKIFGIYRVSSEFDGSVYIDSNLALPKTYKSVDYSVSKDSVIGKVSHIYLSNSIKRIGAKI